MVDGKKSSNKSKPVSKCGYCSPIKKGLTPKTYTKFSVPINQILYNLKNEPWFKLSPSSKEDTSKLD